MSKTETIIDEVKKNKVPRLPYVSVNIVAKIVTENLKDNRRRDSQYLAVMVEGSDEPLAIGNKTKIRSLEKFLYHLGSYENILVFPITYLEYVKMKADGYYVA